MKIPKRIREGVALSEAGSPEPSRTWQPRVGYSATARRLPGGYDLTVYELLADNTTPHHAIFSGIYGLDDDLDAIALQPCETMARIRGSQRSMDIEDMALSLDDLVLDDPPLSIDNPGARMPQDASEPAGPSDDTSDESIVQEGAVPLKKEAFPLRVESTPQDGGVWLDIMKEQGVNLSTRHEPTAADEQFAAMVRTITDGCAPPQSQINKADKILERILHQRAPVSGYQRLRCPSCGAILRMTYRWYSKGMPVCGADGATFEVDKEV